LGVWRVMEWWSRVEIGTVGTARISAFDWYHCRSATATRHLVITRIVYHPHLFIKKKKKTSSFLHPLSTATQPQPHFEFSTIRTALISSIDWHHYHPATATPRPVLTRIMSRPQLFFKKIKNLTFFPLPPSHRHSHSHTSYLVPFEPP
jgi:hypothetical protein